MSCIRFTVNVIKKCNLIKVLTNTNHSFSGRLRELKSKGKDQLVIPKSGRGLLRELSLRRALKERVSDKSNGSSQRWS